MVRCEESQPVWNKKISTFQQVVSILWNTLPDDVTVCLFLPATDKDIPVSPVISWHHSLKFRTTHWHRLTNYSSITANQQKLITVRSYTENYRQSYSIRTVKDWNSLPQSIVSAGSLALFKSCLTSHAAPWLHSPSVWCPCQGPCQLIVQIHIQQ